VSRKVYGLRAWLWQRLSALYIGLYVLLPGLYTLFHPPAGYAEWRGWVASPALSIATALFFGALLIHAWVGTRDILMDYVHPFALRAALLGALGAALAGSGLWVLGILYALR
jgi:succinate dehydrogenase / fumarate reductase membrane anchor subunit